MQEVSHGWVRAHPGGERGFCMGRFEPRRLHESWLAVAWNPIARRVEGFVTWVPIWARHGWAIDLMRRRLDSAPGTMELLVTSSVEQARARGDALLSLSLSALASVDEPALEPDGGAAPAEEPAGEAGPAEGPVPAVLSRADRAREFLSQHLARFYDFKGLFRWKKKFDPEFEDRFLVYPNALALPQVVIALVRAQSPGGGLLSYLPRRMPHP
jgi:phosphatidylglycerol lysyltransferase